MIRSVRVLCLRCGERTTFDASPWRGERALRAARRAFERRHTLCPQTPEGERLRRNVAAAEAVEDAAYREAARLRCSAREARIVCTSLADDLFRLADAVERTADAARAYLEAL